MGDGEILRHVNYIPIMLWEKKWSLVIFQMCKVHYILFIKFIFRERGREGEREEGKYGGAKVASAVGLDQGPEPQPRHVSRPGIEPAVFCFAGQRPTN